MHVTIGNETVIFKYIVKKKKRTNDWKQEIIKK